MYKFLLAASLISLSSFGSESDLSSIVGKWKTVDDESGEVKSIVQIKKNEDTYSATVKKLFKKPDEDQNPLCDACKGDLKNAPIIGLEIIHGLKKRDDDWGDGTILDPNNGKTYSVKMSLKEKGMKLKVRGFLGFSLLGRTQYWHRQGDQEPGDSSPKQ